MNNPSNDLNEASFNGRTEFHDRASAGAAAIVANAAAVEGGGSGTISFQDHATAASGVFTLASSGVAGANGGIAIFAGSATAANSLVSVGGGTVGGAYGSYLLFVDTASAGAATLLVSGGLAGGAEGGHVVFTSRADAGRAGFTLGGGEAAGAMGSSLAFMDASSAANGVFSIGGGKTGGAPGASVKFSAAATAANGRFAVHGEGADSAGGGSVEFVENSTAGSAIFSIEGGGGDRSGNGVVAFYDDADAGHATFTLAGGNTSGEYGGQVVFNQSASAANGTFTANGGTTNGAYWSAVEFRDESTAGHGDFTVNGRGVDGARQGQVVFYNNATAGDAHFTLNVGAATTLGSGGGTVYFEDNSTAGNAVIDVKGGVPAGGGGSQLIFEDSASAGNATLIAEDGPGQQGALIIFRDMATGGTPKVRLLGRGELFVQVPALTIGSLEGTGVVAFGGSALTLGGDNASTTFAGSFRAGAGSLTKAGTGTFTLSGPALYTGPTTVTAGTLQLGDGGTSGSVAGDIVNEAALVVNRSDALTLPGRISGAGTLTKIGAGTLTLSGANTFTGATNVEAGGLILASGSSVASVQVAAGATFGGAGTVRGNLANAGILSISAGGALTVSGNFTQAAAGKLALEIASPTSFGQLTVAGAATLGGTAEITAAAGVTFAKPQRIALLTAGGVTGKFASVSLPSLTLPLALGAAADYDAHGFAIEIVQKPFATLAATPNGTSTAGGLDQAVAGGGATALRDVLDGYTSPASLQRALNELSPLRFQRWFEAAAFETGAQVRSIEDRLATAAPGGGQRGAWVEGIDRHANFDGDADVADARLRANGIVAGADFAGAAVLGAELGYERTTLDLDARGSRTTIETFRPAVYGRYAAGAWGLDAVAGYAHHGYESRRTVAVDGYPQVARGST
ncbi:MAG TPA: autotransporter-associated beta strand repeat-containing protein, partial [Opitutus sp.]|nr:autotransporter-associated beta strand repeat-containing protein [Opitutus sp.]